MSYHDFIASKAFVAPPAGIEHPDVPREHLFPFQHDLTTWCLRRGKAACFADTGLGKSRVEAHFANSVVEHTGGKVLMLAPLGVVFQLIEEAASVGISIHYARSMADTAKHAISITNYDRLHLFDLSAFQGVVLDESSIIKSSDGKTRTMLIEKCTQVPFRLAATATPSPNDHTELLQHAEFLGIMPVRESQSAFFYHDGGDTSKWTLKRHATQEFWRWVASWAALVKFPSDLGYSDDGYILPPLNLHDHMIGADHKHARAMGLLFAKQAKTLDEQRKARRATLDDRCKMAAELAMSNKEQWVIWCDLNPESTLCARLVPGAAEVRGGQSEEERIEIMRRFTRGDLRVLVTKQKICGFGMNWQNCAHTAFVGATHSYEGSYQAIRRFWRFGQKREVNAHFIYSELEGDIMRNLRSKYAKAEEMSQQMRQHCAAYVRDSVRSLIVAQDNYNPTQMVRLQPWMTGDLA